MVPGSSAKKTRVRAEHATRLARLFEAKKAEPLVSEFSPGFD
jgi:hypothetical protein